MTGRRLLEHLKILPQEYLDLEIIMETECDGRGNASELTHIEVSDYTGTKYLTLTDAFSSSGFMEQIMKGLKDGSSF